MKKRISMKDIAQRVGVSTALVSYVLNNKKTGRISKDVAERIRRTARELNYTFNHIAKSLKTNRTNTIGVIVSDISNPFSSSLARIIQEIADRAGYTVIFGSMDENEEKAARLIDVFLNRQVDGIILAPAEGSRDEVRQLLHLELPFVLIDRRFPDLLTSCISIDNRAAAYTGVRHLLDNGYRRIGFIIFDTALSNLVDRRKGYELAMEDAGIIPQPNWIRTVSFQIRTEEMHEALSSMLNLAEPVDAIFFGSNRITAAGLKFIKQNNIVVPDQLGVLGFDQVEGADLFYSSITHIRQPLEEIGKAATEAILQIINREHPIVEKQLEATLVVGDSSRPKT